MAKTKNKQTKNRATKVHLVFDETKRKEFLTGFHKRKVQRKKNADEKFKKDLLEERKRLKTEARESYKKLVVSHRSIPELDNLMKDEYEDEDVTVRIEELSTDQIALSNNWIGANRPKYQQSDDDDDQEAESSGGEDKEKPDVVPGMELEPVKVASKVKKVKETTFKSEKELKRHLKKEATKKIKKSKVFQQKNKVEQRKQRKKSQMMKNERFKIRDKKKR